MDPITSSETDLTVGSGLSRSQTLQLEILKESIFEKYGTDADLVELFLETNLDAQWPIFTLLYPKAAFLIDSIVDAIRGIDKLFVDDYESKLYGIETPLSYVDHVWMDEWREKFDYIIAAGPSSNSWNDIVWELRCQAKKLVSDSLINQMHSSIVEMPERISSQIEEMIGKIKARSDFFASRMIMIQRCETERQKELMELHELRRRKTTTSQTSSNSNPIEAGSPSFYTSEDHLTGTDEGTIDSQTTALELPRPAPSAIRTHSRRSQPVHPILPATNSVTSSKSLFTSHSTTKWQSFIPDWSFLGEKTTVLCLIPSLVVISAILIGVAITRSPPPTCAVPISKDDNFFANISQTILSLSSLYCTIIPFLRSREVSLNLFWFRVCLLFSAATGVASVVIYAFQWQISLAFGYLCSVFQVFATFQLVEGIDATIS